MEPMGVVAVTIVLFSIIMVAGLPIAFALAFSGIVGILLKGGTLMLAGAAAVAYGQVYSFSLLAIPCFIIMGNLLLYNKVGSDLYDTAYKWIGFVKGGLAIASTGFCALFGFMCGSTTAACATIGGVAIPEMEKKGYNRRFALGSLAVSGTLANLIPPSAIMIVYAVASQSSMGDLFIAGIFPGLLLAALIAAYIYIRAKLDPSLGPSGEKFTWKEKIPPLVHLIPVVIVFVTVLGGIYMGIWSAVEAGAAGAIVTLLICLAYRRVTWSRLRETLRDSVRVTVMIYMLIVGANIFSYVFFLTGFQKVLLNFVMGFNASGWVIIVLMGVVLMVLGTFLEVVALILICVPIFLPISVALGFNDIWFGIMIVLFSQMAQITPPVGVSLFVILGIAPKGTTLWDIAVGAMPYVAIIWVCLGLLIIWPEIALWLPSTMHR